LLHSIGSKETRLRCKRFSPRIPPLWRESYPPINSPCCGTKRTATW
jgi:hypothetical protein